MKVSFETPSSKTNGIPLGVIPGSDKSSVTDVENVAHTYSSFVITALNKELSIAKGGEVRFKIFDVTPEYNALFDKFSQLPLVVFNFCHW